MQEYSEADIEKIINACEILILPDNTTIEEVLSSENQALSVVKNRNENLSESQKSVEPSQPALTDKDFESIYQRSKIKLQNITVSCSFTLKVINFNVFNRSVSGAGRLHATPQRTISEGKAKSRTSFKHQPDTQRPSDRISTKDLFDYGKD